MKMLWSKSEKMFNFTKVTQADASKRDFVLEWLDIILVGDSYVVLEIE